MTARVAAIGCGYWGKNLVRNFAELGVLSAVSDANAVVAAEIAARYGVAPRALDEILSDPAIDAVAIAAPAALHASIGEAALLAGKHVFVEKPLALTVTDAERLCDLADARRLTLMVGHLLQYHPAFLALKALVDEGALGRLQYLYSNRLNLGKIRREENILWSFAPHDISMILSLVGAEPESVWATGGRYLHDRIADVTTTHLAFASGQRAHVHVSWLHPFKEQKLVVIGDRAMAVLDDGEDWPGKLRLYRHQIDWRRGHPEPVRADAEAVPLEPSEPLREECAHFIDSVERKAVPRTDGREGVRVLKVLAKAEDVMTRSIGSVNGSASGVTVHPSAYVDEPSEIGEGTRIWHFSHVLRGSRIGRDCSIGQNVVIGPDVSIGDRCKIQNNVSVYEGVTLEQDVFCGPSCVFTNVVNPRAEVSRRDEFRPTVVRRGASIGANATIVCGHEIGAYAFIAAGAVVTSDVPPHALMAGVPARRIGWVSHDGQRLGPDLTCRATGRQYVERDGALVEREREPR